MVGAKSVEGLKVDLDSFSGCFISVNDDKKRLKFLLLFFLAFAASLHHLRPCPQASTWRGSTSLLLTLLQPIISHWGTDASMVTAQTKNLLAEDQRRG